MDQFGGTVDPEDVGRFAAQRAAWWDPNGNFRPLHRLNPARLDFIRRRLLAQPVPAPKYRRGYGALFLEHVMQAHDGCDFDFLRKRADEPFETEPLGVATGWIGGW